MKDQKNDNNPMTQSMNTMNKTMPLFSVFMCFTLPSGLGIYWVASALVRMIQQAMINHHLDKIPMDELIKRNQEKARKKREKHGTNAGKLQELARENAKNISDKNSSKTGSNNSSSKSNKKKSSGKVVKSNISEKEREEKLNKAEAARKKAKPGSLAAKAGLVRDFNENNTGKNKK